MLELLRDYQRETIENIDSWFMRFDGNPCVEAPTASGKSWIIAGYVFKALSLYPDTHIIILAPQRELIEQDREKLLKIWPLAPVSTYCASLNQKETGTAITIATIQSIYRRASVFGHIDLVLVDEAHLINTEDTGMYRSFIKDLKDINPSLKCIGFTATPFRMKHGLITDSPSLFSSPLIRTRSIPWLQERGYLCRLSSKHTDKQLDVSSVHKDRTGDYKQNELERAVDTERNNTDVLESLLSFGKDRHSWLIFCSGVSHSIHFAELLKSYGITCEAITGETDAVERARILAAFKAGTIRAITNNNVLTTGFDAPNIDLIAMLRPTMSPGLHSQMLGRGLRVDKSKQDTLILDYAGNILRHGGIYDIKPPAKAGRGLGIAPLKICPDCQEYLPMSTRVCSNCGYVFPAHPKTLALSSADAETGLMTLSVKKWAWSVVLSRKGEIPMLLCRYYGYKVGDPVLRQYYCIMHNGYAREKAFANLAEVCIHTKVILTECSSIEDVAEKLSNSETLPKRVTYRSNGGYLQTAEVIWEDS